MKHFQRNLLIYLAAGLCGLCAWQWYIQSVQSVEIEKLAKDISERNAALQGCTNTIKATDHQVAQLDAEISRLKAAARTNEQQLAVQNRELEQQRVVNDSMTNSLAAYTKAVDVLKAKLSEAYDGVKKQNDSIKQLVEQRDDLVSKYNASVKDRNDVVDKYNELVKKFEMQQKPGREAADKDGGK